jgi:hypothetical protein
MIDDSWVNNVPTEQAFPDVAVAPSVTREMVRAKSPRPGFPEDLGVYAIRFITVGPTYGRFLAADNIGSNAVVSVEQASNNLARWQMDWFFTSEIGYHCYRVKNVATGKFLCVTFLDEPAHLTDNVNEKHDSGRNYFGTTARQVWKHTGQGFIIVEAFQVGWVLALDPDGRPMVRSQRTHPECAWVVDFVPA